MAQEPEHLLDAEKLALLLEGIQKHRERILTNSVLIGQIPPISVNVKEDEVERPQTFLRARTFLERFSELGLDECTTDPVGNPLALIKGSGESGAVIIIAAHMDTVYHFDQEVHLSIDDQHISGPGLIDNSLSLGILLSLPEILDDLGLKFRSDIVLLGLNKSLGETNLSGIREFLRHWKRPVLAGVVLEGAELGRLNFFSRAMCRMEITCEIPTKTGWENKYGSNAILILNDVINRILEIHIPQRPATKIIFGKISGGVKHGDQALYASLGLEIESGVDHIVDAISSRIHKIVDSIRHEHEALLTVREVSAVNAARLEFDHDLVQSAARILKSLGIQPRIESSESELSIFLSHSIPALTLGITHGEKYHTAQARVEIEPIFKGIAQIVLLLQAIDEGI